jgi:hypothetical protein
VQAFPEGICNHPISYEIPKSAVLSNEIPKSAVKFCDHPGSYEKESQKDVFIAPETRIFVAKPCKTEISTKNNIKYKDLSEI